MSTAASTTLPCKPESAGLARRFVTAQCARIGASPGVRDDAVLLTSEVVGNAIEHGRSEIRLSFSGTPARIHVEVADDNTRMPVMQSLDPDALDGRGLTIIDCLAARWGVDAAPIGKVVWFDLDG